MENEQTTYTKIYKREQFDRANSLVKVQVEKWHNESFFGDLHDTTRYVLDLTATHNSKPITIFCFTRVLDVEEDWEAIENGRHEFLEACKFKAGIELDEQKERDLSKSLGKDDDIPF